ncbi:carboxylesterase 3 isoform X3 [Anarrhichthys ocellatus]|uniref:carboxylesterase 3 isoform X3 n=1 Tax=Anarrhichthys ocellatus TaxID=433405 RepID=UPI0012EDC14F|nr:carboxylesterase 5A-like isoform X3 [Anarrhichthys ocellatus]
MSSSCQNIQDHFFTTRDHTAAGVCRASKGAEGFVSESTLQFSVFSWSPVSMRTALLVVCLLPVLTATAQSTPAGSVDPVVALKNGRIRGQYVTVKGTERRVKQYLGLPFSRPPVGPLRLAAPQDTEPWEGERDCTHQPPMCIQDPELIVSVSRTMSMQYTPPELSEDCLYLNVYTPAEATEGDKVPVMVWIHGGGLSMGAASQYDGAPLAAYENIVMVIIQYRLGILGFLSTGDEHAQGNWGFLDQLAALRWVQESIEAFGGDPQTVTVAGESAGGISASILTLSPQAEGLFQRAVFQSGVATLGTYTTRHPLGHAKIVANLTGCDRSSTEELVQCMKGKSKEELVDATKKASSANNLIADEYMKDAKTPEEIRDAFTEIVGDLLMTLPVVMVAGYHSDAGVPVYMYEFVYRAGIHKDTRPSFVKADHADDVGFMFGGCFWSGHIQIIGNITTEDERLCRTMMSYWGSFTRTGSPNGPGLVVWPQYDRQKQEYLELGLTQTVRQNLRKDRVHFATVVLPQKLEQLAATAAAEAAN